MAKTVRTCLYGLSMFVLAGLLALWDRVWESSDADERADVLLVSLILLPVFGVEPVIWMVKAGWGLCVRWIRM